MLVTSRETVDLLRKPKENNDFSSRPQSKTRCIATQTFASTQWLCFCLNFMIFLGELKISNLYRCHANISESLRLAVLTWGGGYPPVGRSGRSGRSVGQAAPRFAARNVRYIRLTRLGPYVFLAPLDSLLENALDGMRSV